MGDIFGSGHGWGWLVRANNKRSLRNADQHSLALMRAISKDEGEFVFGIFHLAFVGQVSNLSWKYNSNPVFCDRLETCPTQVE